jgi:hypothetical protein
MLVRLLLIALGTLALTGCWIGQSLYSPSDAFAAIPAGVYRAITRDEPERAYQVTLLPNGLTQIRSGEDASVYGFAPLDQDTFVAWAQIDGAKPGEDNQFYALMARQPGGTFLIYPPSCADEQAEIARKNGATIGTGIAPACRFGTRSSLERALRQMPRAPSAAMRLERIP